MNVRALLRLTTQAQRQRKLVSKAAHAELLGGRKKVTDLTPEERVHMACKLMDLIGGELWTLFDTRGGYEYAVGRTAEDAAKYIRNFFRFTPVYFTSERLRECGGPHPVRQIFERTVASGHKLQDNAAISVEIQDESYAVKIGENGIITGQAPSERVDPYGFGAAEETISPTGRRPSGSAEAAMAAEKIVSSNGRVYNVADIYAQAAADAIRASARAEELSACVATVVPDFKAFADHLRKARTKDGTEYCTVQLSDKDAASLEQCRMVVDKNLDYTSLEQRVGVWQNHAAVTPKLTVEDLQKIRDSIRDSELIHADRRTVNWPYPTAEAAEAADEEYVPCYDPRTELSKYDEKPKWPLFNVVFRGNASGATDDDEEEAPKAVFGTPPRADLRFSAAAVRNSHADIEAQETFVALPDKRVIVTSYGAMRGKGFVLQADGVASFDNFLMDEPTCMVDPSMIRDYAALLSRKTAAAAKPVDASPPKSLEHPLQRVAALPNAWGR